MVFERQIGGERRGMTRVLIAVDDTETSIRAAEAAHMLFGDVEYLAINVCRTTVPVYTWASPEMMVVVPPTDDLDRKLDDELAEDAIDTAEQAAHQAGIDDVEPIVGFGDISSAILSAAKEHDVDVIVVGWSDKTWFGRLLDGSVPEHLVRDSEVPVFVGR